MAINYLAVLAAAVAVNVLGMFWYSPAGFANAWVKAVGFSKKQIKDGKNKGMAKPMAINFVVSLVEAFVLANFVMLTGAATALQGAVTGVWLWLGFIATTTLGIVLWEGKPAKLWVINNGFHLAALALMGAILAAW